MFETLSKKFQDFRHWAFASGTLTEKNINDGLQKIRTALLEADVNYKVAQDFIDTVQKKSVGQDVIKSISPGQQIVKIVSDELTALMGPIDQSIRLAEKRPTIIMMVGLQGSGKTTTCAKLAKYLVGKSYKPLLVAADVQRPAAIDQLKILGEAIGVPVFTQPKATPPEICKESLPFAQKNGCNMVILDTAGRLHINEELMAELKTIQKKLTPENIFLVCDAMTGQDAVNSAKEFNEQLAIDGVILTKLDGDARGGAALSIKAVTGKPIKFVGVGEKLDKLEEFYPERMASRILGMGDVVSLVEKAEEFIDKEKAEELQQKLLNATFSFEDFLGQLQVIKKMGSIQDLLGMLPGELGNMFQGVEVGEKEFAQLEGIIYAMTPEERQNPDILDNHRRARIAKGSGADIQEVNQLIKQFRQMRNMMRSMGQMGGMGGMLGHLMPGFGGGHHFRGAPPRRRK